MKTSFAGGWIAGLTGLMSVMLLTSCSDSGKVDLPPNPVAAKAALYAGLESWDQVTQLKFTFHAKLSAETEEIIRTWTWEPKSGQVVLERPDEETLSYSRFGLADGTVAEREADEHFINDSYWLLFPLHLAWDEGLTLKSEPGEMPGSGEPCQIVQASYDGGGGYTPGDIYDVMVEETSGKVLGWAFYPKGAADPKLVTRWEDYETFGPLKLSLNRPAVEGEFRVWFTGVEVVSE